MKTPDFHLPGLLHKVLCTFFIIFFCIPLVFSQENNKSRQLGKSPEKEQGYSLLGKPLFKPKLSQEAKNTLTANYNLALKEFRANPSDPEAHIWLGRRLAYMGDYLKAIAVFSDGIYFFPNDARFFRHRGHRYITIRKLDFALADFKKASEMIEGTEDTIEPDGAPNPAGIPVSSLHSNIWYHLGLTQYLLGDFKAAFDSYERCYMESSNNDKIVSSGYWLYLIGKRLGKDQYCSDLLDKIAIKMELIENFTYHELLLFYESGKAPAEYGLDVEDILTDPTRAYGLGMYYHINGDKNKAHEIFNQIMELPSWGSFGYIAAEAELARLK